MLNKKGLGAVLFLLATFVLVSSSVSAIIVSPIECIYNEPDDCGPGSCLTEPNGNGPLEDGMRSLFPLPANKCYTDACCTWYNDCCKDTIEACKYKPNRENDNYENTKKCVNPRGAKCKNGDDWDDINMVVYIDPKYANKTLENRGFYPTIITPYDDIICSITISNRDSCGMPIDEIDYTKVSAKIITTNTTTNESETIMTGKFNANGEWKIQGWAYDGSNKGIGTPKGWTNPGKLKKIIDNGNFACVASFDGTDYNATSSYTNCLHIWGNDSERKIALHYGESTDYDSKTATEKSIGYISRLFETSPFREYSHKLSAYSDLNLIIGDMNVPTRIDKNGNIYFEDEPIFSKINSESACVNELNGQLYHNFEHNVKKVYIGYTSGLGSGWQFIRQDPNEFSSIKDIFAHEFGHSFGGLYDEYYDELSTMIEIGVRLFSYFIKSPNCNYKASWFKNFGDKFFKCILGKNSYRPSENSLMRYEWKNDGKFFNVASCGYVLQRLGECSNSNISECWEKCMNSSWNTIKPTSHNDGDLKKCISDDKYSYGKECCGDDGKQYGYDPDKGEKCCTWNGYGFPGKECCGEKGKQVGYDPDKKKCCILDGRGSPGKECCGEEGKQLGYSPEYECCNKNELVSTPSAFLDPNNPKYGDCE